MGIQAAFMLPHPPLIIPEIGRGEEKKIQKTIDAYEHCAQMIAALRPETIIVISPHQTMYADYFHISPGSSAQGDFARFGAPQVRVRVDYDTQLVARLCEGAQQWQLPAGTDGERDSRPDHGTMVPLYFVNRYLDRYRIVRMGLSGLPLAEHYKLGQCLAEAVQALDTKAVLIASGDLSHRLKADGPVGYRKEGPEYDRQVMDVMEKADFVRLLHFSEDFCEKAGECGHRSFTILAGALEKSNVHAQRLSYEGPFGVGYGICAYTCTDPESAAESL